MIRIDRKDFEQSPATYLESARAGETVVILDETTPVAELRPPLKMEVPVQRMLGFSKGLISIPPTFFDPLPDDELALWSGESQ